MLGSIAVVFIVGLGFSYLAEKARLPSIFGMIVAGILVGPFGLNMLNDTLLSVSPDLRQMALVIILVRAGLSLNIGDLKKVGRPALLMCFVPAVFEIVGVLFLAPNLFDLSLLDAAIMGTVLAAVSPAVIVPKMLKLMDEGYGTEKGIPQLIMAGASVDDVFVIVLFTAFTGLAQTGTFSAISLIQIPLSIVLGIAVGYVSGSCLSWFFEKTGISHILAVLMFISLAFGLISIEDLLQSTIPFSGLLAIMATGVAFQKSQPTRTKQLSHSFLQLWQGAEILLFVLVGATVNIHYAFDAGISAVLLIAGILCFRLLGVYVSLIGTSFTSKEKLFCLFAYIPKATVQAAIGGIPLALGLSNGDLILTVAVVAILVTAPLGAGLIDTTYKKLLTERESVY